MRNLYIVISGAIRATRKVIWPVSEPNIYKVRKREGRMRKTRHISGSLQKQLLIYMILIALIPALFLLFWYFDYVRSSTVMQLGQDNGRMLAHAVDKLDVVAGAGQ